MNFVRALALPLVVILFLSLACALACATPDFRSRPGTINHALSQPDGTLVCLDAVHIDKIKAKQTPAYFTIREQFDASLRIVVLTLAHPDLRMGQVVDISGDLVTLPNGQRALSNAQVIGYTDRNGRLLRNAPIMKGYLAPTPWQWKVDLTFDVASAGTLAQTTSSETPNIDPADTPSYYAGIGDILAADTAPSQSIQSLDIPGAQGLPAGSLVELHCKRIISVGTENIGGTDYKYVDIAEDLPAQDWIRTYYSSSVPSDARTNILTGQVRRVDTTSVICVESGPDYDPQIHEGFLQAPAEGTIAWAKTFPDGTSLPALLSNKVVSRAFPSEGCFYIQEPAKSGGIRVYSQSHSQTLNPGDTVTVSGSMFSQDGERKIIAASVTAYSPVDPPRPIGMSNKALGGGDTNTYTPGITGSAGTSNLGILVKTWGKVTSIGSDYFYMDDGSRVDNGSGNPTGLKVSWEWRGGLDHDPPIAAPEVGWYVRVTGVSGSQTPEPGLQTRVLRLRSQHDLELVSPADGSAPTVTLTNPPNNTLHKAPGGATAPFMLAGTACDDIGIAYVEVMTDGSWLPAQYNRLTRVWTFVWQSPASQSISIRATDFAGKTRVITPYITVETVTVKHVTLDGDDQNTGDDWATSLRTVGAALGLIGSSGEIWVADGTYQQSVTLPGNDLALYGGFCGAESYREQRNWGGNLTVLAGQYGRVITAIGKSGITIDGFTIRDGVASDGGGIYCNSTSATIANNIIRDNRAVGVMGFDGYGGGLYATSNSVLTLAGNVFLDNYAESSGGGVFLAYSSGQVINNTIRDNTSSMLTGGGISIASGSIDLLNNIVAFNNFGGVKVPSSIEVMRNNCVYGNTQFNYSGIPDPTGGPDGNISLDPLFGPDRIHLLNGSPCIDSGSDTAAEGVSGDIDSETRISGAHVDIGADEYDLVGCSYKLTLEADPTVVEIGHSSTIIATVSDPLTGAPAAGVQVRFSVVGGDIVSLYNHDQDAWTPEDPPIVGFAFTGANGKAYAEVESDISGTARITASVISACGLQFCASTEASFYDFEVDGNWPMFMRDPQHTGMSPIPDTTRETLTLAWSAEVQTATTSRSATWSSHNRPGAAYIFMHPYIDSSPVVVGNVVVVGSWARGTDYEYATGSVKAFNGESGSLLWTATGTPSMGGVASTPCIYNDNGMCKVYVGTTNGYLYCLNLATGAQLWAQPTTDRSTPAAESKIIASPVVHDGIVYIGNEAAKVYAFDATTGALQQSYPVTLPIEGHLYIQPPTLQTLNMTGVSSPAVASVGGMDYLLLGCDDGYFYRITLGVSDPQSTLLGVNLGYCVESSPTVVGDKAYIGISCYGDNQVFCILVEPLQILRGSNISFPDVGQECRATLAVDLHAYLYVGVDTGHTFHKLLSSTLADASRYTAPSTACYFVGSAAVCGNGLVYVGNDDGIFRALTTTGLSQSASHSTGTGYICSSPAIAYNVDANHNRWVYVTTRNQNGKLLAFKTLR